MAEVDAHVYYWSSGGMTETPPVASAVRYIEVREAERLLEEAHARGQRSRHPRCGCQHDEYCPIHGQDIR